MIRIYESSEGLIPIVYFNKEKDINEINAVKVFIGAQHNEYNGLFGMLEFLENLKDKSSLIESIVNSNQLLIFLPIMNPYGFLNPRKDNKSGYYLKNGSNLNRFWRRTFVPGFIGNNEDLIDHPIPEHATLVKNIIDPYWNREDIKIYMLDFHETSLLEKYPKDLSLNLSNFYKFDHWLKETIVRNIMMLYNIKSSRTPLFFKCSPSADHAHLNLSLNQIEKVREKLFEYLSDNIGKLPFYFVHSKRSEECCLKVGTKIYENLKSILWKTAIPVHGHEFHDHGCLVRMNDATERENLFCVELENQKQFFDIFEEIERSKRESNYLSKKLTVINNTLTLIKETIREAILLKE